MHRRTPSSAKSSESPSTACNRGTVQPHQEEYSWGNVHDIVHLLVCLTSRSTCSTFGAIATYVINGSVGPKFNCTALPWIWEPLGSRRKWPPSGYPGDGVGSGGDGPPNPGRGAPSEDTARGSNSESRGDPQSLTSSNTKSLTSSSTSLDAYLHSGHHALAVPTTCSNQYQTHPILHSPFE